MDRRVRRVWIGGVLASVFGAWAFVAPSEARGTRAMGALSSTTSSAPPPARTTAADVRDAGDLDASDVTPPEEDSARTLLRALEARAGDAGAPTPARHAMSRARELLDRSEAWSAALRVDEARLAENAARVWLDVATHSLAVEHDVARARELDAGGVRARAILAQAAGVQANLEARRRDLIATLGEREGQLGLGRDAGARR